jgi:hypothetical protein
VGAVLAGVGEEGRGHPWPPGPPEGGGQSPGRPLYSPSMSHPPTVQRSAARRVRSNSPATSRRGASPPAERLKGWGPTGRTSQTGEGPPRAAYQRRCATTRGLPQPWVSRRVERGRGDAQGEGSREAPWLGIAVEVRTCGSPRMAGRSASVGPTFRTLQLRSAALELGKDCSRWRECASRRPDFPCGQSATASTTLPRQRHARWTGIGRTT